MRFRETILLAYVCSAGVAACDSPTEEDNDPGGASYAVSFEPGRLVYATEECDRLLTHAVLSLGRPNRGFDLSVNLVDDCSRAGGGYAFWEVLILGDYSINGNNLTFVPESPRNPQFSGTFDAEYVHLSLPARSDSLAPMSVALDLGPKVPF